MPKTHTAQVTVSGLATNPNPNALPAGSCAVAENVVSRRPGVLSPLPRNVDIYSHPAGTPALKFGKFVWDEANEAYVAVILNEDTDPFWDQDPVGETMEGRLEARTLNQRDGSAADWAISQLPIGRDTDRNLGFLPGLTQSAYNHFRTFITEKWGVVCSTPQDERWTGLVPPVTLRLTASAEASWFIDGNSVQYRAYFSIESTIQDKPYESWGPVSFPSAILATVTGSVQVRINLPSNEYLPVGINGEKLFVLIFRSSQVAADYPQDIPLDFRLVYKREVEAADLTATSIVWEDIVTDAARENGEPLYTNDGQEGEKASGFAPPCARDVIVYRDSAFYANRASLPALTVTIPGPSVFKAGAVNDGLISDDDRTNGIGTRYVVVTTTNGSNAFSIANVSQRLGITVYQQIYIVSIAAINAHLITSFDPVTGNGTFSPAAGATGNFVAWVLDTYYITVDYADGTNDFLFSPLLFCGMSPDLGNPALVSGLRIFGVRPDYALPSYGQELTWLITYPAFKRVTQFSIGMSNGQNYSPPFEGDYVSGTDPLISLGDTRPNRLFFSRTGQPEAVPLLNYQDIGAGTILKMWPTQSALLILCTDGLWRLTGDDAPWQVNQVDPTVLLVHPDCMGLLNNEIYAWVQDGLAKVNEDGALTISTDAVGYDIRDWHTMMTEWGAPYVWGPCLAGDNYWNEVWLNIVRTAEPSEDPEFVTTLIYNSDSQNFTRQQATEFLGALYSPDADRLITVRPPVSPETSYFTITTQTDFDAADPQSYQPVTIWFNAIQTEDKGMLKQWMDMNVFVARVETALSGGENCYMHALFNARNADFDPYQDDFSVNTRDMAQLSRDVHFWVPRRAVLSDQLQIGLQLRAGTSLATLVDQGFNFQLQGFTIRYRVASDTFKR